MSPGERVAGLVLAALLSAPGATVRAQEAAPAAADPPAADEAAEGFRWRRLELRGRALVRLFSDVEEGTRSSDVEAENARLELRWRPARWLRAVVEADAAEGRHLKDAFVALRGGRLEARLGQFKPPVSPVQMESRWDLPVADRGLLAEVLIGSFGIAGRRPGVQLEWDQRGGPWRATAGAFRASSVRGDRIGDEAFDNIARDWSALKATARLAWGRKRLEVGASFDLRPAEPLPGEGYGRFWTSGLDLTWRARRDGPRAWVEGFVGSSWQDASAFDGQDATFLAGRAVAGWRFGGRGRRKLSAEPYATLTLFDPDTRIRDDVLWEAAGGVHVGGLGHLRLVLGAEHRKVARNAPPSLGLFPPGKPPFSRTRLVAQVGAAF